MLYTISTQIEINASAETIWTILMDFNSYEKWNPFITRISGNTDIGGKLKADIGNMKFKPIVQENKPLEKFSWLGRLVLPGIFDGLHEFQIKQISENKCLFIHQEKFKGMLVPLFKKKLEKEIKPQFEKMNQQLKLRAE